MTMIMINKIDKDDAYKVDIENGITRVKICLMVNK